MMTVSFEMFECKKLIGNEGIGNAVALAVGFAFPRWSMGTRKPATSIQYPATSWIKTIGILMKGWTYKGIG